ncbi:MAG: hypothetical protein IT352_19055 [Gemmatimonadales bacterium]|nr:hypothetical protein [Gemmatimonadales bacterium]
MILLFVSLFLGSALATPASAQVFHVGAARSVLQYDFEGERAFGGWRAEVGWAVAADIRLVGSVGFWPNLFPPNPFVKGAGRDQLAEVRWFPAPGSRVEVFALLGLGHFRGPDDTVSVTTVIRGPNGLSVVGGLGAELGIVGPIRAIITGLRREDAGAANFELRLGLGLGIGGRRPSRPRTARLEVVTGFLTSVRGRYRGDGLGYGLRLGRGIGKSSFALLGAEILPVDGTVRTPTGDVPVDTDLLLFSLAIERSLKIARGTTIVASVGAAAATFQEGADNGLRPGVAAMIGMPIKVGGSGLMTPGAGIVSFTQAGGGSQHFVHVRLAASLGI